MRRAGSIACYAAIRGEVDCTETIREAWRRGRRVYLPVVRGPALGFAQYARGARLVAGRFGIPVPAAGRARMRRARELHVVVAPVVAFDANGHRIGTGGGFYDRTLAFRRSRRHPRKPVFIGVAYTFQQVEGLVARAHDVPLDLVVTPRGVHRCTHVARGGADVIGVTPSTRSVARTP
jgi:5-formyltetrahydrofolate cyclo-ligase